jgi:hypothetical protein
MLGGGDAVQLGDTMPKPTGPPAPRILSGSLRIQRVTRAGCAGEVGTEVPTLQRPGSKGAHLLSQSTAWEKKAVAVELRPTIWPAALMAYAALEFPPRVPRSVMSACSQRKP